MNQNGPSIVLLKKVHQLHTNKLNDVLNRALNKSTSKGSALRAEAWNKLQDIYQDDPDMLAAIAPMFGFK